MSLGLSTSALYPVPKLDSKCLPETTHFFYGIHLRGGTRHIIGENQDLVAGPGQIPRDEIIIDNVYPSIAPAEVISCKTYSQPPQ